MSQPAENLAATPAPDLEERVRKVVAKHLNLADPNLAPATSFSDLGADSIDSIEILLALEKEFDRDITLAQSSSLRTVQDAIDYVNMRIHGLRNG